MKVTLGGRYRVHEFGDAIDRVCQNLLANGVDEIQHVTFYLNVYRERRSIHLVNEDGTIIEHLKLDGPRRRRFEAITNDIHIASQTDASSKEFDPK